MDTEPKQDNTIKLRIDDLTLELLDRATKYTGLNKSKFIRQSIREKAETIIAEHEKTNFTEADWKMFFSLLDQPIEATDRMKKARKKYSEIVSNNQV